MKARHLKLFKIKAYEFRQEGIINLHRMLIEFSKTKHVRKFSEQLVNNLVCYAACARSIIDGVTVAMTTRANLSLTSGRFDGGLATDGAARFSLVQAPQKMHVEIIFLVAGLPANRASEWIHFIVAAHVQSVHHFVSKSDVTMATGSILSRVACVRSRGLGVSGSCGFREWIIFDHSAQIQRSLLIKRRSG